MRDTFAMMRCGGTGGGILADESESVIAGWCARDPEDLTKDAIQLM